VVFCDWEVGYIFVKSGRGGITVCFPRREIESRPQKEGKDLWSPVRTYFALNERGTMRRAVGRRTTSEYNERPERELVVGNEAILSAG